MALTGRIFGAPLGDLQSQTVETMHGMPGSFTTPDILAAICESDTPPTVLGRIMVRRYIGIQRVRGDAVIVGREMGEPDRMMMDSRL